jgi:hypothetical protein
MQQRRRSGIILGLLALGLLAGVPLTAGPAQAVDAAGPYYALPSWDRKIAPVNRFVVLTNWNSEAVLDKETGLVWEQSPQTATATWINSNARLTCANKTVGNRKGWRLPSFPELASVIDPSVTPGPTLPAGHPFTNVLSSNYWSASANAEGSLDAWYVGFSIGHVSFTSKNGGLHVWCVRGGMNADQY